MIYKTLFMLCLATCLGHARGGAPSFRFDSDASICLDGEISDMVLWSKTRNAEDLELEMFCQLFYLTGLLNHHEGSADIGHATLRILQDKDPKGTGFREVRYKANFLVSWPRQEKIPTTLPIALPRQADEEGMSRFFNTHYQDCSKTTEHPDLGFATYYYYYRPNAEYCTIFKKQHSDISYGSLRLRPSKKQSQDKYPEYHKVWEDGKLVATAIFCLSKPTDIKEDDQGIVAYNRMYEMLLQKFGKPAKANVIFDGKPGTKHPDIELQWYFKGVGTININILLSTQKYLEDMDQAFKDRYNQRTRISDYISYNGHSGYGTNIGTLATMGSFTPGQWQLYYINGCHSFCYFQDDLDLAHQAVNPGSKPYDYVDLITNGMSAYFMNNAPSNMVIISALIEKKQTYRQIFEYLDESQKPCVMGEENNKFKPKPQLNLH